jgi:hypothetical protein
MSAVENARNGQKTMSVCGYFGKDKHTRMPKGKDSIGIRSEGAVMTGEKSVEQVQHDDARRQSISKPDPKKAPFYQRLEDYDPVLRFHCRLDDKR